MSPFDKAGFEALYRKQDGMVQMVERWEINMRVLWARLIWEEDDGDGVPSRENADLNGLFISFVEDRLDVVLPVDFDWRPGVER